MRVVLNLCSVISVLMMVALSQAAFAQNLALQDIRIGHHGDKTRLVVELDRSSEFRAFILPDPYRVVVDLPVFDWQARAPQDYADQTLSHIRYGNLKSGVSRLVFEAERPFFVKSAFVLPRTEDAPHRLVVDVEPVSAAEFASDKARSSKIIGSLDINSQTASPPSAPPPVIATNSDPVSNVLSQARSVPPKPSVKPQAVAPAQPAYKPLIVLDPGHGGQDPGAVGHNKAYEKDVVLALSKELKRQLEASGRYRVKLTRDTDVYIRLSERVAIARRHEADLFVSIHADSIDKGHVHGASVYTLSEKASDKQTAALAERENRSDLIAGVDLSHEDEDVANILMDLVLRDTMNQSRFFANGIVDELRSGKIEILDNPHRYAGFAVLKAPDIPSILIEAGFMSNRKEAARLRQAGYRAQVAESIKDGIDAYFRYVEENGKS